MASRLAVLQQPCSCTHPPTHRSRPTNKPANQPLTKEAKQNNLTDRPPMATDRPPMAATLIHIWPPTGHPWQPHLFTYGHRPATHGSHTYSHRAEDEDEDNATTVLHLTTRQTATQKCTPYYLHTAVAQPPLTAILPNSELPTNCQLTANQLDCLLPRVTSKVILL